ncbi:DUF1801 domain-containing protein [Pseudoalteromonas sp. JBTF-M23]|uniref:DUF1801 domain-containing protein n=1 Tax=Pseudoalteromonas caenipelagi TaxID=2726988 RepID=A0A849VAF9_9GAMM|nr:DUF1801 domain-containing protein [Pseudoalteromonas caenipelagi]NOU49925.1 DUF1801 domain-containing protein [Pseudoalteromonas caenipelagi]
MSLLAQQHIGQYPELVQTRLIELRSLIYNVAEELALGQVEESLKWGELSYQAKHGSPIRIDWKRKTPDSYYLFFSCNTKLVDTFGQLYADKLDFEGSRAIKLSLCSELSEHAIKHCIELGLRYKKLKHLPLLGC